MPLLTLVSKKAKVGRRKKKQQAKNFDAKRNDRPLHFLLINIYIFNILSINGYPSIGKLAGASYAILKDGKLVAMETMGYQDLEKKVPLTDQTIFRVFSQSKPVGSAGFLTLIDEVSPFDIMT